MSVQVRIPSPLLSLTQNKSEVNAEGSNVKEVLEDLEKQFSGLRERLFDESGSVRRFINIYINEEDIRFLDGENTQIKDGDEISIIPAIAGGK
ncbi:MAG TPA: ubiquitin-like small modifier protein 1 [Nitrospinota bacterium]|nr:ubiquitin-like small modifier protein 1 [Nitrospinota bacterium]